MFILVATFKACESTVFSHCLFMFCLPPKLLVVCRLEKNLHGATYWAVVALATPPHRSLKVDDLRHFLCNVRSALNPKNPIRTNS